MALGMDTKIRRRANGQQDRMLMQAFYGLLPSDAN